MSGLGEIALIRGLNYLSESQAAIAHNLANVTSFGFKRRIPVAEPVGQDFNEVLEGRYPTTRYTEIYDLSVGTPNPTGNASHMAIQAKQFLKVQSDDGRMFFSREGQLQLNNQRELVTTSGHRILDREHQPILFQTVDDDWALSQVKISPAGEITVHKNNEEISLGRVAVFEVPDVRRLSPAGDGLYSYPDIGKIRATPTDKIVQGALEQSNVEPTKELIDMIIAQRGFQASMGALRTLGRIKEAYIASLAR